jgi:hypothetical protein
MTLEADMPDGQARIIVGASEVAGDRRQTYLLFEQAEISSHGESM